jgi:SAM-dependent methyltransferase
MNSEEALTGDYQSKDFKGYFQIERQEMLRYVPQQSYTIIDVGCGSGSFDQLFYKNWHYADCGILDRTHLRFFTRRSILENFENLGYCVECIEGINPLEKEHSHYLYKFRPLNWLLLKNIGDMRYLQFAVVAHPQFK